MSKSPPLKAFVLVKPAVCALASILSLFAGVAVTRAQEGDALLEMLQKRGILSDKDAASIRAEAAKKREEQVDLNSSAARLKLSDSVTQAKIFGEIRLGYWINEAQAAGLDATDHGQRDRLRYRFRLGSDIVLHDGWSAGFLLETGSVGRSPVVTLGENPFFAKSTVTKGTAINDAGLTTGTVVTGFKPGTNTPVTGTVVKSSAVKSGAVVANYNYGDTIFVGRVFLKYDPTDWLSLEGGKIANPFKSTRMIWDPNVNPEGFAEQFRYSFGGNESGTLADTGKDAKLVTPPAHGGPSVNVYANFGQFIYDDVGFENTFNTGAGPFAQTPNLSSRWMMGFQFGARINLRPNLYFEAAPTFYSYTGGGLGSAGPFNGDSPLVVLDKNANAKLVTFNQTGANDLGVFDIPMEFGFKVGPIPAAIFGDFAYNVNADTRAEKAGHANKGGQDLAYQVGASIGSTKKKGDIELRGFWQHTDAYAVDQNLVDFNVFDGRTNMAGFYLQGIYQLSDGVSFIVQYCHGERIDNNLGTPGFGALGTAPGFALQRMNLVYFDLNVKF